MKHSPTLAPLAASEEAGFHASRLALSPVDN
jgi:hypothetical protein